MISKIAIGQVDINEISVGNFELIEVRGINREIAEKINKRILIHSLSDDELDYSLDTYGILRELNERHLKNGNGTTSINTVVKYNQSNILSIAVTVGYLGAYPWAATNYYNFSTQTGELLHLDDIINKTGFKYIDNKIRKEVLIRKDKIINGASISTLTKEEKTNLFNEYGTSFSYPTNFTYKAGGISFFIDYRFPYVAQGLEPNDEFEFKYSELLGYFVQDKGYAKTSDLSTYTIGRTLINNRFEIYQDAMAFSKLLLGNGKVMCNVCVDDIGKVIFAQLIDSDKDKNIITADMVKPYLKAIYESRYEPNFDSSKEECMIITKYH